MTELDAQLNRWASLPAGKAVPVSLNVETERLHPVRQEVDELRVGSVAGVFRTKTGHPDLLLPDFLLAG